jgi:hypothetical protein
MRQALGGVQDIQEPMTAPAPAATALRQAHRRPLPPPPHSRRWYWVLHTSAISNVIPRQSTEYIVT